jgi:hypothetical protein
VSEIDLIQVFPKKMEVFMFDIEYVSQLTGLSELKRDMLLRYYARLPEQIRLQVHESQTDLMRSNRKAGNYKPELIVEYSYAMLLLALRSLRTTETALSRKKRISLTEAKTISKIRVERVKSRHGKKRSKMEEKIEKKFHLIQTLREDEKMSWRDIAVHLVRYHQLDASFSYLRQCYSKLSSSNN